MLNCRKLNSWILIKKEDIKLIVYGIVTSAYITIFYDIFQELAKKPIDINAIGIKAFAGFGSLIIGLGVLYYLTYKKR